MPFYEVSRVWGVGLQGKVKQTGLSLCDRAFRMTCAHSHLELWWRLLLSAISDCIGYEQELIVQRTIPEAKGLRGSSPGFQFDLSFEATGTLS